jgi:hypothetical protein
MRSRGGERNARFLWTCKGCKQQFTVKVGTVMEDSPIPLRHWAYAWWAACSSKKGVSAKQIQRVTGLSYRSALFLMHRVRYAMAPANAADTGKLGANGGTVEVDETYVGGKPRYKGQRRPGRPASDVVAPVVALVERGGRVRMRVTANTGAAALKGAVREHVDASARVITDEYQPYRGLAREFAAHETVKHKAGEYARGDVTTNTVEGVFSLLKRGLYGTFHSVSRAHLHRYVSGFEFRFDTRHLDDGARTVLAIQSADNKRLTYKEQTGRAE